MKIVTKSIEDTRQLGENLGRLLSGGEFIELVGDLGAGKTVLVKGVAAGMGIDQPISSPTFTVSRVYPVGERSLHHFDFYRLAHGDIVALELAEAAADPKAVIAIEWAEHASGALPDDRLIIKIAAKDDNLREIEIEPKGQKYAELIKKL